MESIDVERLLNRQDLTVQQKLAITYLTAVNLGHIADQPMSGTDKKVYDFLGFCGPDAQAAFEGLRLAKVAQHPNFDEMQNALRAMILAHVDMKSQIE